MSLSRSHKTWRGTGDTVVASSEKNLAKAQRGALAGGEVAALPLKKVHAEVTALATALVKGVEPAALAATRAFCPQCAQAIEITGGTITSPTTAIWKP
jgi:tRNA(Arg) A34 adenosine deaminase TadA